ncbi:potassium-transporting ATPase subunit F [Leptospira perolatii]
MYFTFLISLVFVLSVYLVYSIFRAEKV